jgi:hypothetical protein
MELKAKVNKGGPVLDPRLEASVHDELRRAIDQARSLRDEVQGVVAQIPDEGCTVAEFGEIRDYLIHYLNLCVSDIVLARQLFVEAKSRMSSPRFTLDDFDAAEREVRQISAAVGSWPRPGLEHPAPHPSLQEGQAALERGEGLTLEELARALG